MARLYNEVVILRTIVRGLERPDLWQSHPVHLTAEGLAPHEQTPEGPALWVLAREDDRTVLRIGAAPDARRSWTDGADSIRAEIAWATGTDRALGARRAERRCDALLFWGRLAETRARLWVLRGARAATYEAAAIAYFGPLWEPFRALCLACATTEHRRRQVCAFGGALATARELDVALPELEPASRRRFWW